MSGDAAACTAQSAGAIRVFRNGRRARLGVGSVSLLVTALLLTGCANSGEDACPLSPDDVELYEGVEVADVTADRPWPESGVGLGERQCNYNLTAAPHFIRVEWSSTPGNLLSVAFRAPESVTLFEGTAQETAMTGTLSWGYEDAFEGRGLYLHSPVLVFDAKGRSWRVDVGRSVMEPQPGEADEYARTIALKISRAIASVGIVADE